LADAVVFPTPPFPEVITITRPLIQFTRLAWSVLTVFLGFAERLGRRLSIDLPTSLPVDRRGYHAGQLGCTGYLRIMPGSLAAQAIFGLINVAFSNFDFAIDDSGRFGT